MNYPLTFADYSKSLKAEKLLGLTCKACGYTICPPRSVCPECATSDFDIAPLEGAGCIKSFTVTHVAPLGREAEAPYIIVLVALNEGPWIVGNLVDMDPYDMGMDLIGKQVKLRHKVFPGDLYSAGDAARPLFCFAR